MPSNTGAVRCLNPDCLNDVDPNVRGRRRKYCSDGCGRVCRRLHRAQRTPDSQFHDAYALQVAEETARQLIRICEKVRAGEALETLSRLSELAADLEDLKAATVQQARDRGYKTPVIAQAMHITTDKLVRTYAIARVARRMRNRRARPGPTAPGSRAPDASSPPAPHDLLLPAVPRPPAAGRRPGAGPAGPEPPGHLRLVRRALPPPAPQRQNPARPGRRGPRLPLLHLPGPLQ